MFKNSEMYFNNTDKVSEIRELVQKYHKVQKEKSEKEIHDIGSQIISAMNKRVKIRYFSLLNQWDKSRDSNKEQWGFIMMSVNCILIELYYQLSNGIDETGDMNDCFIKEAFKSVVPLLDNSLTQEDGELFYDQIRCKLIHQAQTSKNVAISFDTSAILYKHKEYNIYNPSLVYSEIRTLYCELFQAANVDEVKRNNVVNKVSKIVYKSQ